MNELTEKLWPAFQAEAGEQLDALELALAGTAPAAVDVHSVFRSMHTIKGGCAMMGFSAMEALAHAAEDLLDLARRGDRVLDDGIVDALLATVDALKRQLQEATRTRRDPAPLAGLVERLRALANAGSAERAPRPAAARPATTRPAADAAPATAMARLAARLAAELPPLAALLLADGPLPAAAGATLAALAGDAAVAALPALAARLETLARDDGRRHALADLLDRLAHLQQQTGVDAGVAAAVAHLREPVASSLAADIHALEQSVRAIRAGSDAALAAQSALLDDALLLQLPQTVRLLRFTGQVLREVARGNVLVDDALLELLAVAVALPHELAAGCEEDGPYVAMCEQVLDRLRQVAIDAAGSGDALRAAIERLRDQVGVRPETLDTLSPRAIESLREAVERRETIVEIEADLESTPDFGEEFVAWLSTTGRIISNHTVFHRATAGGAQVETTRLRFLAALPAPLEEIKRTLGELDPQRRLFDLHHCAGAAPAAAPRTQPVAATESPAPAAAGNTLRIDSATLDQFVNRVGEMVMLRNMLEHTLHDDDLTLRLRQLRGVLGAHDATARLGAREIAALDALLGDVEARLEQLAQADLRLQGALGRLQEDVLGLRVVPIGMVFNRLPRVVRDLSHAQRKQVELLISGEDVRIDKSMVEILLEPLMHMVRNSIDHGIEDAAGRAAAGKPSTATVSLSARQQGNTLLLEVADDGRGLDAARIRAKAVATGLLAAPDAAALGERELYNLIFLPGFSTADKVTEVSGRGVGMDVVRTRIAQVGGQIEVQSTPGAGTRFTLRLPLTVAIQNVVLVASGSRQYALPERNVTEVLSIAREQLQHVQGQAACLLRGVTLPVYEVGALLGGGEPAARESFEVVVLNDGVHRIGLLVDRVIGRPEVFVRDMHPDIARLPGVGGVSILGDGRVVIILDCENLFELAVRNAQSLRNLLRAS